MRLATLLTVPILLTALTAQEFSDSQRKELRKIIREEIRAAMRALHGTDATALGGSTRATARLPQPTKERTLLRLVDVEDAKKAQDEPKRRAQALKTQALKTTAPKSRGIMLFSQDGAEPIVVELDDVTNDVTNGRVVLDLLGGSSKPVKAKKTKKKKKKGKARQSVLFFSKDGGEYGVVDLNDVTNKGKGIEAGLFEEALGELNIVLSEEGALGEIEVIEEIEEVEIPEAEVSESIEVILEVTPPAKAGGRASAQKDPKKQRRIRLEKRKKPDGALDTIDRVLERLR